MSPTHREMAQRHLRTARRQPIRELREDEMDLAEAYGRAAETGEDLAAAAQTSTDPSYIRRLARKHEAAIVVLPVPSDRLPTEAA